MSKLPSPLTVESINGKIISYVDALELYDDLHTIRRILGWDIRVRVDKDYFRFVMDPSRIDTSDEAQDMEAGFKILVLAVHRDLWPSKYPQRKTLAQSLRRMFFSKGGLPKLERLLEGISKEPVNNPSALDRLLNVEDDV